MFYKKIKDGYIESVVKSSSMSDEIEITEAEYRDLIAIISSRPASSARTDYRLRADTLEWEPYALPQIDDDEISAEDALAIISGGEV